MFIQFCDSIIAYLIQAPKSEIIDTFSPIPDELFIEIFKTLEIQNLCKAALVCKKFNQIQNLPVLWEIQAKFFGIKLDYSKSYKFQIRNIKLNHGQFDLFKNVTTYPLALSDRERKMFCKEVAFYSPPNREIIIYSKRGEKTFCARIDQYRTIRYFETLEKRKHFY